MNLYFYNRDTDSIDGEFIIQEGLDTALLYQFTTWLISKNLLKDGCKEIITAKSYLLKANPESGESKFEFKFF